MQLQTQPNGRHKPAPQPRGVDNYRSRSRVDYRVEAWALPGLGVRWYASRGGRYLDRDGYTRETVEGATPFAGVQEARYAIDEQETVSRALWGLSIPPTNQATTESDQAPEAAPRPAQQLPTSLVFRCRGNRYVLEQEGACWLVRLEGRPVVMTPRGGEACFDTPMAAQEAAERHAMIGHRESVASHLEALAGLVRRDPGAVVVIESGDVPGETVIRIRGLGDQSVT